MGFRNPVTSLRADQITPGTLGPAIVAQTLATATSGARVVISGDDPAQRQFVNFHTSSAWQVAPGEVSVKHTGAGLISERAEMRLRSPVITDNLGMRAEVAVRGSSRQLGVLRSEVEVTGEKITLSGPATVSEPATLLGSAWQNIPMNGAVPWAPYTTNMQPKCRKDAAGRVQLDGLVAGGYFQTTIATLPEGFRPVWWTITSALVSIDGIEKQIRVDVFPDGPIVCGAGTGTAISYLSLAAISFPTF